VTDPSLHPLFASLGGAAVLRAAVDHFYDRVFADAELAPFFAATDRSTQREHQYEFLAAALGGPHAYRGRSLRAAHRGRGITAAHFARVAGHLQAALLAAGVPAEVVRAIVATAATLQPEIVDDRS
jgi:hemoglobin